MEGGGHPLTSYWCHFAAESADQHRCHHDHRGLHCSFGWTAVTQHSRERAAPRSPSESRTENTPGPPHWLQPARPIARRHALLTGHSHTVADGIGEVLGRDARPTTYSRHLSDDGAQSRKPLTHIWESSWTELRGRRMHVRKMAKTKNAGTKNGMDEKWQTKSAWTKTAWTKISTDEKIYERKNARTKKYRTKKCTDEKYTNEKSRRKKVQTKIYPYGKLPDENLGTKNCETEKCETRKCGTKICGRKNARRKMVVTRRVQRGAVSFVSRNKPPTD